MKPLFAVLLLAAVGCVPQPNQGEADAQPKQPKVDPDAPVVREPDVGPRANARTEAAELEGVSVRVKRVWVSHGIDDGNARWGYVPTHMMMKVRVEYKYLKKDLETTYYWWSTPTVAASAIYDDQSRKSPGDLGHSTYTKEECRKLLKQGIVLPTEETYYFKAPKQGSPWYDMDVLPEHLPPGKRYQFRIPNEMIEWPKTK